MALVASALLHALMVLSLSRHTVHGSVFSRPVVAPLSVRIERPPEVPQATSLAIQVGKAPLHPKISAPRPAPAAAPEPVPAPVDIEPPSSQPGVSVAEKLYLRPLPGRVSSARADAGQFLRLADVSERPQAVAMRMPAYPRAAQEQKLAGWVIVMLLVDATGHVVDTAAVESSEAFSDYQDEVAQGLLGSAFTPGKIDGRAVKTMLFATVWFDPAALPAAASATRESVKKP